MCRVSSDTSAGDEQSWARVDWRSVLFFGVPGMAGTFLGAWLARFVPGTVQLLLFAALMLVAAVMMLRKPRGISNSGSDGGKVSNGKENSQVSGGPGEPPETPASGN